MERIFPPWKSEVVEPDEGTVADVNESAHLQNKATYLVGKVGVRKQPVHNEEEVGSELLLHFVG